MLTVRTSHHVRTNRERGSLRRCPASTGVPRAGISVSGLLRVWRRLLNAESRRLWLDNRWNAHVRGRP